jgi:hypothetical protein
MYTADLLDDVPTENLDGSFPCSIANVNKDRHIGAVEFKTPNVPWVGHERPNPYGKR